MTLKQVVESLIFASQKPLTPREILTALRSAVEMSEDEGVASLGKSKEADVTGALDQLRDEYQTLERSFQLVEEVSGWKLLSKPEFGLWVRQLYPENRPTRLSAPALETLAIVAYRQPITKADIEAVRGVAVDGVLQTLLDRGLVKIAGRAEIAGRPLLYETTQHFLEHFGLKNTEELPNSAELRRMPLPTAQTEEKKESESAGAVAESAEPAAADTKAAPGNAEEAAAIAPDEQEGSGAAAVDEQQEAAALEEALEPAATPAPEETAPQEEESPTGVTDDANA